MVHPQDGVLFSHKKERLTETETETQKRRANTEGRLLYDPICVDCPEGETHSTGRQRSGCYGLGEAGMETDCCWVQGFLKPDANVLWNLIVVKVTQHCQCTKCH